MAQTYWQDVSHWRFLGLSLGFGSEGSVVVMCHGCEEARTFPRGDLAAGWVAMIELGAHVQQCPRAIVLAQLEPETSASVPFGPSGLEVNGAGGAVPRYGEVIEATVEAKGDAA